MPSPRLGGAVMVAVEVWIVRQGRRFLTIIDMLFKVRLRKLRGRQPGSLAVTAIVSLIALGPLQAAHAFPRTGPTNVSVQPNLPSPQPAGTPIIWTASATDNVPLVYQFSVATAPAGPFKVVRDFSNRTYFAWAPLVESTYYIQVTAKEGYTGTAMASSVTPFTLLSRVINGQPVVSATANPLVALYSAPSCSTGQTYVRFRAIGTQVWTSTHITLCQSGQSNNFLVAGMLPSTSYEMQQVIDSSGMTTTSPSLTFTTGALPRGLIAPHIYIPVPPTAQSDQAAYITFHAIIGPYPNEVEPVATDLAGHVVWYTIQPDILPEYAVRIEPVNSNSGDAVLLQGGDGKQYFADILRTIDLAGNPIQETNMYAINAQLAALGDRTIYGFSHESYYLPNGYLATMGFTQKWVGSQSYLGDMVIVLDQNLRVVWTWDDFDHLNLKRLPPLRDKCYWSYNPCPVPGGKSTIDFSHLNAIDYSPTDGNLLLSLRAQDWVVKVNYSNGTGDGSIIWTLGKGGDFKLIPLNRLDIYPWFSHQHDANYIDGTTIALLDNGVTRCTILQHKNCHSRGQVYSINEATRVATQLVNVDLGQYSIAYGTAQRLSNGNYNFTLGILISTVHYPYYSQDFEVQPNGTVVYQQQYYNQEYRAWRMESMDGPTNPPCPSC